MAEVVVTSVTPAPVPAAAAQADVVVTSVTNAAVNPAADVVLTGVTPAPVQQTRPQLAPLPLPRRQPAPQEFGSYRRGEELGSGGFSCVFRCYRRTGIVAAAEPQALAVKVIDLKRLRLSMHAERSFQNLRRETEILKSLPAHPNVVRMVDSVEDQHWFFLVLELVAGGDLFEALVRQTKRCLVSEEAAFVMRQLVQGLSFLHGRGIVHRDLKPENILVASAQRRKTLTMYTVKITDFGLSKAIGGGLSEARSIVGTRKYVAPEVLSGGSYDCRVDLWSLGVLLYLLLDGRFPNDSPAHAAQTALDAAVARLRVGRPVQALVARLLRLDPRRRMSLDELAEHAWLQDELPSSMTTSPSEAVGTTLPTSGGDALEMSSRMSSSVLSLGSAEFSVLAERRPFPPGAPAESSMDSAAAAREVVVGHEPLDVGQYLPAAGPSLNLASFAELDSPEEREAKRARTASVV